MKVRNTVESDLYDQRSFESFQKRRKSLRDLAQTGGEVHPNFPFLLEDLFRYLYKEDPKVFPEDEVHDAHKIQRKLLEALRARGLDSLRQETMLDEDKSILVTEELGQALLEIAKGNSPSSGEGEPQDDPEQLLREFLARVGTNPGELKELLKKAQGRLTRDRESEEIIKGLEAGFGRQERFVDRREEFKDAMRLTEDLRKLAKSLGRLISANFRRKLFKVLEGAEETYAVTEGRDLPRLLLSERYKLLYAEDAFWLRYLQEKLLSYKMRSRRPLGRGPKIYLIDLSGSTDTPTHVKQALEKLVALAISIYSKKEAPQLIMYFQSETHMPFPMIPLHKPPTVEEWEDIAKRWGNGGTDFVRPLSEAVKIIEVNPAYAKADIVLLTDGDAYLSEEFVSSFNAARRELGFSLISILIDWGGGTVKDDEVNKVSDRVAYIRELLPDKILRQITRIYDRRGKPAPESEDPNFPIGMI